MKPRALLTAVRAAIGGLPLDQAFIRQFVETNGAADLSRTTPRTAGQARSLLAYVHAIMDAEEGDPHAVLPDERYEDADAEVTL